MFYCLFYMTWLITLIYDRYMTNVNTFFMPSAKSTYTILVIITKLRALRSDHVLSGHHCEMKTLF